MRYHTSDIDNTPLGVLRKAVDFSVITTKIPFVMGDICMYGAGWNSPIPKPHTTDCFNALIVHKMITLDKIWAQQENYEVPGTFLRNNNFDLIVSGDNHNSFHYWVKDVETESGKLEQRWLINCGSLMRSKIDQEDHKPCVWVYDTDTRSAEQIFLQIKPFNEVFDLEASASSRKRNERLAELADSLKKKSRIKGLDYKARVAKRIKELGESIKPKTKNMVEEMMGDDS